MQLAQKLAGFSLGEADLMRRAMGKKKREEMALHEKKFVSGAVERNIKKEKAEQIFSLMAQFADYGFNRSHSVAYAYLAFQTAYLKAHYPEHFYAAVLSNEIDDTAKVLKYSNELRGQGIILLPPDVNESHKGFTPLKGAIRYGLAAIKGIGQGSVEAIIEARADRPFLSFFDFIERVPQRSVNKRVLEGLIYSGAFDSLSSQDISRHQWRANLFASLDSSIARASRAHQAKSSGQNSLLGFTDNDGEEQNQIGLTNVEPWSHSTLLSGEKNSLGFYITGHPLDDFSDVLGQLQCCNSVSVQGLPSQSVAQLSGIITGLQIRQTKKGDSFALFRLEDQLGSTKCIVWSEGYNKYKNFIVDGVPLLISGKLDVGDDNSVTLIADELLKLEEAQQKHARSVIVRIPPAKPLNTMIEKLFYVFSQQRGDCEVLLEMFLDDGVLVRTRAHGALRIEGSLKTENTLRDLGCEVEWVKA